jgi:hypothetical protein
MLDSSGTTTDLVREVLDRVSDLGMIEAEIDDAIELLRRHRADRLAADGASKRRSGGPRSALPTTRAFHS